nr:MAG TPA: putative terminase small subunit [Caudoviricetes sp.]
MMARRGRKPADISKQEFEKLCALQCTQEEICSFFDVTDKTLTAFCRRTYGMKFSEVFREKRGKGKIALRRSQFRLAERNATMAIFLGKQYLGQRDVQDVKVEGVIDNPFDGVKSEDIKKLIGDD